MTLMSLEAGLDVHEMAERVSESYSEPNTGISPMSPSLPLRGFDSFTIQCSIGHGVFDWHCIPCCTTFTHFRLL